MLVLDVDALPDRLFVGTSSFSTSDWCGTFYPHDARPRDFLAHYATRLRTVEIDATFYASPAPATVAGWARKTPDSFVISAKVPKAITHEAYLVDAQAAMTAFLTTMDLLGPRLGPLLLQFPYVSRQREPHEWETGDEFRRRLGAFLPTLPRDRRFVVEVRNERWLGEPLVELLEAHRVALAVTDYYTMPAPHELVSRLDPITADFAYVRYLGDHRRMDAIVNAAMADGTRRREWESVIVDRSAELSRSVPVISALVDRGVDVYTYFNNHYAGFAPGSIDLFIREWMRHRSGGRAVEFPRPPDVP